MNRMPQWTRADEIVAENKEHDPNIVDLFCGGASTTRFVDACRQRGIDPRDVVVRNIPIASVMAHLEEDLRHRPVLGRTSQAFADAFKAIHFDDGRKHPSGFLAPSRLRYAPSKNSTPFRIEDRNGANRRLHPGQIVRAHSSPNNCFYVGIVREIIEATTKENDEPASSALIAFPTLDGNGIETRWIPTNLIATATNEEVNALRDAGKAFSAKRIVPGGPVDERRTSHSDIAHRQPDEPG
jgi:hypothetical protein